MRNGSMNHNIIDTFIFTRQDLYRNIYQEMGHIVSYLLRRPVTIDWWWDADNDLHAEVQVGEKTIDISRYATASTSPVLWFMRWLLCRYPIPIVDGIYYEYCPLREEVEDMYV